MTRRFHFYFVNYRPNSPAFVTTYHVPIIVLEFTNTSSDAVIWVGEKRCLADLCCGDFSGTWYLLDLNVAVNFAMALHKGGTGGWRGRWGGGRWSTIVVVLQHQCSLIKVMIRIYKALHSSLDICGHIYKVKWHFELLRLVSLEANSLYRLPWFQTK